MVFNYTKKELRNLLITVIILTFVFAFDDGRDTFILANWLTNFIKVFFIISVGIIIHDLGHDFMAKKHGFNSEFKLWGVKRFNFGGKPQFPRNVKLFGRQFRIDSLPIGAMLAILVTFFSNGQLYWAAVSSYSLVTIKSHRLGRRFVEITDFEEAKLAIAGPLALTLAIIILKLFNSTEIFDLPIFIYSVITIYDMLPLPGLDGFKAFAGSIPLYISGFAFIISTILFVHYLNAVFALLLAILIAIVFGGAAIYKLHR
ncbi:MAG: hypothetical protein U9Q69_06430 [Nanoarchaeota archaeon]|nr:hypothetical protein [Nanoarchaeota archaeon]